MKKNSLLNGCPSCGSKKGYKTTARLEQYYSYLGEGAGYDFENASESNTAVCVNCGHRISTDRLMQLEGQADEKG